MGDKLIKEEVCWFEASNILQLTGNKEGAYLKKKEEITICSSAAEYLIYVASIGDQQDSIEIRYEDENIWLT